MKAYTQHYINGEWVEASSSQYLEVTDSNTEAVMATVPAGTAQEAAQAVMAARAAFAGWSALSVEKRAVYLDKITAGLKARSDELTTTIASEVGMPLKMAGMVQVGMPIFNWGNFAK